MSTECLIVLVLLDFAIVHPDFAAAVGATSGQVFLVVTQAASKNILIAMGNFLLNGIEVLS